MFLFFFCWLLICFVSILIFKNLFPAAITGHVPVVTLLLKAGIVSCPFASSSLLYVDQFADPGSLIASQA